MGKKKREDSKRKTRCVKTLHPGLRNKKPAMVFENIKSLLQKGGKKT